MFSLLLAYPYLIRAVEFAWHFFSALYPGIFYQPIFGMIPIERVELLF